MTAYSASLSDILQPINVLTKLFVIAFLIDKKSKIMETEFIDLENANLMLLLRQYSTSVAEMRGIAEEFILTWKFYKLHGIGLKRRIKNVMCKSDQNKCWENKEIDVPKDQIFLKELVDSGIPIESAADFLGTCLSHITKSSWTLLLKSNDGRAVPLEKVIPLNFEESYEELYLEYIPVENLQSENVVGDNNGECKVIITGDVIPDEISEETQDTSSKKNLLN